jgi:SnoaL-like domain
MSSLHLPDPIAAYFAADQRDASAIASCFAPGAVVKDEGRTHTGLDAIRAWKTGVSAAYTYTCEPFAFEHTDGADLVTSRVTGTFPGSPVDLQYRFRVVQGLIASLEITA